MNLYLAGIHYSIMTRPSLKAMYTQEVARMITLWDYRLNSNKNAQTIINTTISMTVLINIGTKH